MTLREYIRETVVCVGVYLLVATFYWKKGFSATGLFCLFLVVALSVPIYLLSRQFFRRLPNSLWFYPREKFSYTVSMIFSAIVVFFILSVLGLM